MNIKREDNKVRWLIFVIAGGCFFLNSVALSEITFTYPPISLDYNSPGFASANTFDLSKGDIELSFTINAAGVSGDWQYYAKAGLTGGAMYTGNFYGPDSTYGCIQMLVGNHQDSNDVDASEKIALRNSNYGEWESLYNTYGPNDIRSAVGFSDWNNTLGHFYNLWFDRGWYEWTSITPRTISGVNVDTNDIYHIKITYHLVNSNTATMFATINGESQGFYTQAYWNSHKDANGIVRQMPDVKPIGLSFHANMQNLKVFAGTYSATNAGSAAITDLSVKQQRTVDIFDLVEFSQAWLCSEGQTCFDSQFDYNTDKIVNFSDFAVLAQNWLPSYDNNDLPVNLIENGGFETGSGQSPSPWTVSWKSGGGNGNVVTSVAHSGSASYKIWGTSSSGSKFCLDTGFVGVDEKTSYECDMWLKSNTSSSSNIILYVNYYTANKTLIQNQIYWYVGGTYDWTLKEWTVSTPKNCKYLKIQTFLYLSNGYMYLDDVAVYKVPSPSKTLTWDEIVANGVIAYNHFMNQRDYPYYFSTRYNYQTHTNDSVSLPYLIHSIYQYLITSDEVYLNTAKHTADDIQRYLLGGDNCLYYWNPATHSKTGSTLLTEYVATILHSLILLARVDNSYLPLAESISNGIINKYIDPHTHLLCYSTSLSEIMFANEEMLVVKDLLMMYELTGNNMYRDNALNILFASWNLRNPSTNLIGYTYYPDGTVMDPSMKQGGTGGSILNSLNYAYYITQNPDIKTIIEEYSEAINNYVFTNDLNAYRYRTNMDGNYYYTEFNIYEFCYPWLDDAMIRASHITNNPLTYSKAKADFDTSFIDGRTMRNFLIVHGTYPSGLDYGNHQSCIFHTFSAPFTGYMIYLETGDESYLDLSVQFYHQLLQKHKRENPAGYILSVNPYTYADDPYLNYYSSAEVLYLPTIMVPLLIRPVNATVDWNLGYNMPMSGTYLTPVEYRNVSFDYANKIISFDDITKNGFRGRVKIASFMIKDVKLPDNKYAIYVDNNEFYVNQGTDSYTVSGGTYNSSIPRLSSVSDPCADVLEATYDSSSGNVQLIINGMSSTDLDIQSFRNPFLNSETIINPDGTETIQVDCNGVTNINSVKMSYAPSPNSVNVTIAEWQTEEPKHKKWTENSVGPSLVITRTVGDLDPNGYYKIWYTKDGEEKTLLDTKQADNTGLITFTSTNSLSSVVFEIENSF